MNPQSKSTKLDDGLADLHDKHFVARPFTINEMADDDTEYHKVMEAFLLDVQAYVESKVLEGRKRELLRCDSLTNDLVLRADIKCRIAELEATPKRGEK